MINVEPFLTKRDIARIRLYLAGERSEIESYIAQAAIRQLEVDEKIRAERTAAGREK